MRSVHVVVVAVALGLGGPLAAGGQQDATGLEAFGALVIGDWEAEDVRHVFKWGVGRRLIHSASFFLDGGEWKLVSEGIWYWDGEVGTIRSVQIAIDMPVERFEYRSRVRGARVEHDLRAFGPQPGHFVEIWSFSEAGYDWWLEAPADPGRRLMGGSFRRPSGRGGG